MTTAQEKSALRARMLQKRAALSPAYVGDAGRRIQEHVLMSDAYRRAKSVFVYISVNNEPPTDRIIRAALADGKRVYVPKCVGKTGMLAVRITRDTALTPGAFGVPEPADCAGILAPGDADLTIVPCVAATAQGARLGHGAGYYDRFLARGAENAVCLCYRALLCEHVPTDTRDVRIPVVVTEDGGSIVP